MILLQFIILVVSLFSLSWFMLDLYENIRAKRIMPFELPSICAKCFTLWLSILTVSIIHFTIPFTFQLGAALVASFLYNIYDSWNSRQ